MDSVHEPLLHSPPILPIKKVPPGDHMVRADSSAFALPPSPSRRASCLRALRVGALLIGLAGFSYGALLASVLIRMAPLQGLVGRFGGSYSRMDSPLHYHKLFLSVPCNGSAASSLKSLTAVPHVAGTKENMDTAAFVRAKFEAAGLPSHYADYHVLLSYPVHRTLTILAPHHQTLAIKEGSVESDPFSSDQRVIDTFHAYSPSGNVTGEVVYANYGRTEDFEQLARMGINCSGAIVLSRYGKIFRGDKVANAAKAGGVASLVFSDPQDYAAGGRQGVYPNATWLPPSGVQRGSIAAFKGDPLTPGWPSVEDCEQLPLEDTDLVTSPNPNPNPKQNPNPDRSSNIKPTPTSTHASKFHPTTLAPNPNTFQNPKFSEALNLPSIPSLPISYGDALPILEALGGQVAPRDWWGDVNLTEYRLGKGPAKVRLELEMNLTVGPIRNVHAVITGAEEPDRYVILGNHRDAWTFGAVDPNSGTAALIEVARGLGVLLEAGWRPRRTIVLANWDAEEYALIGSSEWAEENEDLLTARAVAYLNVDTGVVGSGILSAGACPQLDAMLMDTAKRVKDPLDSGLSLYDKWLAGASATRGSVTLPKILRLGGAGTDYAGLLQHLGVSSLNLEIKPAGSSGYPMYHSVYDNFHWMSTFGDPGFHYHAAIASLWGLAGLVLADSPILPFDYRSYASELELYAEDLDATLRKSEAPPLLTTRPIHQAIQRFWAGANAVMTDVKALQDKLDSSWHGLDLRGGALGLDGAIRELNDRLMLAERAFVAPEGVPGRPWFRHLVYAPSADDGYGTAVFPGVADALGRATKGAPHGSWTAVHHEIHRVARSIVKAANALQGTLS